MKGSFTFLLLFSMLLIGCSSWKNIPEDIDAFVNHAQTSAKEYSTEDWELSNEEYQALITQYRDNIDKYSKEERSMVTKAIGRYHTLMVINGIEEASSVVGLIKELIPSYLQGVEGALNEKYDGIMERARGLFDYSDIEESVLSLGEQLMNLAEDVQEEIESTIEEYED